MNAFCILFSDDSNNNKINGLADVRTVASVPFAGRYRLVDFMLSSLVGAGIMDIGIVTNNKYGSLMDHVGWGKDWDLNRKNGGIKFLTPYINDSQDNFGRNVIDSLNSIRGYIDKTLPEYCLLCDSNIVFNSDFEKLLDFHISKNADISVVYKSEKPSAGDLEIITSVDGQIVDTMYYSKDVDEVKNVCINIVLLKKKLLIHLIEKGITYGWSSIKRDIIGKGFNEYKIYAYKVDGYTSVINDLNKYYDANMDMLNENIRKELFNGVNPVFTRIKDSVPTIYGERCCIENSLIADGCNIKGKVENCIVFRDVKIEEGAVVKDSIIMQNTIIDKDASLSCVITDKDVHISDKVMLAGTKTMPFIINKGKTV